VKASHGIAPVFDDRNLVSSAGVVPVMGLAEKAGLCALVAASSTLPVPAVAVKVRTVIAGMLAGADSIDDLDVLRSGGTSAVLAGVRAPSTIGTFLRSFTHGHVLQLGKAGREVLAGLVAMVPSMISGDDIVYVDVDDTIREVHGHQKQGASYGYTKVKGLNAIITTVSTDHSAPLIVAGGLRKGSTRSGKGAARYLSVTLPAVSAMIRPTQQVWVRGDSMFATADTVKTVLDAGATFSFTTANNKAVTRAISQIPEDAWVGIRYPQAIFEEETGTWISEAEVAETDYVAFTSRSVKHQVACRLIVRRVKRLGDARGGGQDTLFDTYRHHAVLTNSTLDAVTTDQVHRAHAVVEQVIAELKAGPLAHLPSGKFQANHAWLALATIAFNLSRAAAHAAGTPKARMATILRTLITVPARLARRARRIVMHLPAHWPWATAWANLWDTTTGPPATPTLS
jgi:hypothetical protein